MTGTSVALDSVMVKGRTFVPESPSVTLPPTTLTYGSSLTIIPTAWPSPIRAPVGVGQVDRERLVRLAGAVAVDDDGHGLRRLAGAEGDRAAVGREVGAGRRRRRAVVVGVRVVGPEVRVALGRRVVHRDRAVGRGREVQGEREGLGARVPLRRADVVDRDRRLVVEDRDRAAGVADERVGRAAEDDGEGFGRLDRPGRP